MSDDNSISFYEIKEGGTIILKNPHYREQLEKNQVNEERAKK
jgi:hypothetical protein